MSEVTNEGVISNKTEFDFQKDETTVTECLCGMSQTRKDEPVDHDILQPLAFQPSSRLLIENEQYRTQPLSNETDFHCGPKKITLKDRVVEKHEKRICESPFVHVSQCFEISVVGNIGSGKSTAREKIREFLEMNGRRCVSCEESVVDGKSELCNFVSMFTDMQPSNALLQNVGTRLGTMYNGMHDVGVCSIFQILTLLGRQSTQDREHLVGRSESELLGSDVVVLMERDSFSDSIFARLQVYDKLDRLCKELKNKSITPAEQQQLDFTIMCCQAYQMAFEMCFKYGKLPDAYVFIDTPVDECHRRMQERMQENHQRECEKVVDISLLEELHQLHLDFLKMCEDREIPVLRIDGSINFKDDGEEKEKTLESIMWFKEHLTGKRLHSYSHYRDKSPNRQLENYQNIFEFVL